MFIEYVFYSLTFKQVYTGQTQDIFDRIIKHNAGKVISTKRYRPWILVYTEEYTTRTEAMIRERFLKSGMGREYLRSLNVF
jgi:putative endonuclease